MTTLTLEETKAIYGVIDELSGWNAGNVFAWDGSDDPAEPLVSAMVKLFRACGREIPENLRRNEDG